MFIKDMNIRSKLILGFAACAGSLFLVVLWLLVNTVQQMEETVKISLISNGTAVTKEVSQRAGFTCRKNY